MKTARALLLAVICLLVGCETTPKVMTPANPVRSYNATASVGDFLTISIDSAAQTITYKNYTNGENGTVPYTVNNDGTYAISDPNGNLLTGYEVPGFVLMIEAANAGPNRNTIALITAVESVPATISTFAGKQFNYLQFRTAFGGMTMGTTGPLESSVKACLTPAVFRRRRCRKTLRGIFSPSPTAAVRITMHSARRTASSLSILAMARY